ncbi:MAG: hypothetical protein VYA80_06590 [Pseudomonadota bacterium]|nr:hypothetical protein [Pseudomonadota bacterium]
MTRILKETAIILIIFSFLFLIINIGAWYFLDTRSDNFQSWSERVEVRPQSRKGIELRKKILNTQDENYLKRLDAYPALRPHPVLQFTSGFTKGEYTVGLEGVRYLPNWDDKYVENILKGNNAGYVFGGSTTFGHGVSDHQTLVAYLNEYDKNLTWLNFGVNAYDSIRETDKLLHLLRQGYRPKSVLFLDGLNDLTTFMASPYRSADKPRTQAFLIDRGNPSLIFGTPTLRNMLLAFAYAFPITHLYFYLTENYSDIEYGTLDGNKDRLDYRLMSWHYKYSFEYSRNHAQQINLQWVDHYKKNISFITELGKTFGFKTIFVFQPNGYMEKDNPFMTDKYKLSPRRELAINFNNNARNKIAEGELNMFDCLGAFENFDGSYAFVDAIHYSPQGNKKLVECLMEAINNKQ